MTIDIPDFALVLLVGASGTGKSSFAARHFLASEVVSSDRARGWVSDDETDQEATPDAFDIVRAIVDKRLKNRRLTVVDATNVRAEDRKDFVALAQARHALVVAIVFELPEGVAVARNAGRADRQFGPGPVRRQMQALRRSLRGMQREGIRHVHILRSEAEVDAAAITRTRLRTDRREDAGPFDIIGDVHGCADELENLLETLGYVVAWDGTAVTVTPPAGRRAIFLGDLVDRGPRSPDVLRIARHMVEAGTALAVIGNHDDKLKRHLSGRAVTIAHGLGETIDQIAAEPPEFSNGMARWLDGLASHYWLDGGKLVVAHAGLKEEMHGRASGAVRAFAMYGETTGEIDAFGLPVRANWAADYKGRAKVVHGHTPVPEPTWLNGTLCIDTGCCFGGRLTALRYPEMDLVCVPARAVYSEPVRPLAAPSTAIDAPAHLLDIADVLGRQAIATRDAGVVVVREKQSAAALETISRFGLDPRWLIHLPPTMSPAETSTREGWLERPEEAFAYYASRGVAKVVVEEKHMGSRALIVLARDAEAAARRFGTTDGRRGAIATRTGRRFLTDAVLEEAALARLDAAMAASGLWENLASDWVLWDAEILPWTLKAASLVREDFAPVGAAGMAALGASLDVLARAQARGVAVETLMETTTARLDGARRYREAYNRHVAPFGGIDDLRIAPFHLLASEGRAHSDKDHLWHMAQAHRLAGADPALVLATAHRLIDPGVGNEVAQTAAWWEAITAAGAEGVVVKPLDFLARGRRGLLLQPAIKVRGREYLRIIYGPDYDRPDNLVRLRRRNLATKRGMAIREFGLGLEALHRFVAHEPLTRIHQCIFGVLALEAEPVDVRL